MEYVAGKTLEQATAVADSQSAIACDMASRSLMLSHVRRRRHCSSGFEAG